MLWVLYWVGSGSTLATRPVLDCEVHMQIQADRKVEPRCVTFRRKRNATTTGFHLKNSYTSTRKLHIVP